MNTELAALLAEWEKTAGLLRDAIDKRDKLSFKMQMRSSKKNFEDISSFLDKHQELLVSMKKEIERVAQIWNETSGMIPAWMTEVKQELRHIESSRFVQKKIGSAYKYNGKSQTGNHLKVRAK